MRKARHEKSQSAMEYLMTYGWAILIIAVVLAALFQLGIFGGVFSPRAQPGSCRVIRPLGPGTSAYASLQGVCSGLLPQYVALFNGQSSRITLTNLGMAQDSFSIRAWIYPYSAQNSAQGSRSVIFYAGSWWILVVSNKAVFQQLVSPYAGISSASQAIQNNLWYDVVVTSSGDTKTVYVNRVQSGSGGSLTVNAMTGSTISRSTDTFNGLIANIQIYNTTLSANEVLALYQDGIGGPPTLVQSLRGWWPLNGNANDTSGNLNNGAPIGVAYTSGWTGGYALR